MLLRSFPLLCAAVALQTSDHTTRGVAQKDLGRYSGINFVCDDGKVTLDKSSLNDDYCDCADGTDEPGTSACSQGKFYCANKGSDPTVLPASMVNDGICDCCDGTDEYLSSTCADTCLEQEAAHAAAAQEERKLFRMGYELRGELVQQAAEKKAEAQRRKEELRKELADTDALVETLKMEHERVKEQVRLEQEQEREQKQKELEALKAVGGSEGPEAALPEDSIGPDSDSDGEVLDFAGDDEHDGSDGHGRVKGSYAKQEERKVQQSLDDAQRIVMRLTKELADLVTADSIDYGPDGVYRALARTCYPLDAGNFKFNLCMFERAEQNPGHINIGRTVTWSGCDDNRYSQLTYSNGTKCWDGPERTTTVDLVCGVETVLEAAKELQKCMYAMRLRTPAACPKPEEGDVPAHDEL